MSNNKLTILSEKFENEKSGKSVDGLTLIIDGKIKEMFDIIIMNEETLENYSEVLREIIFNSMESYIEKYKKQ